MPAISLVTKGFIVPTQITSGSGSGGAGFKRDEELPKPLIKVMDMTIEGNNKPQLTDETMKVKSVKIIVEQKD